MNSYGSGGWRGTDNIYGIETPNDTITSRHTGRVAYTELSDSVATNWGAGATRGIYNVNSNLGGTESTYRDLLKSRLWKGVPQLTTDQMKAFEAAYTGHQFFFVCDVPKFMTTGIYAKTNLHQQIRNLKSIIERASTSFNDSSEITANFDNQDDGAGRKMSHMTSVTKEQGDITIRLHEFAGLPVKNALESWLTGVFDINSQHGHYFGNLGIPGGWCTSNHTMSMLVVQTDPSWTEIQDACYYYNMMPQNVPFDHWQWTKGESTIVQDADITFNCNQLRNPAVMYAAEKYMNARILSMVGTSVFNTRQFVPNTFTDGAMPYNGFEQEIGTDGTIIDPVQYNTRIIGSNVSEESFVEKWTKTEADKNASVSSSHYSDIPNINRSTNE